MTLFVKDDTKVAHFGYLLRFKLFKYNIMVKEFKKQ